MDQAERRQYLIRYLLSENPEYKDTAIPADEYGQKRLLRSLFNIRLPGAIGGDFLAVQDEYLREAIREKGITDASSLAPAAPGVYLWQGDITTLKCGAIVNAANSGMTGCYVPCHNCIDNCIHTYAGVQLRYFCAGIMQKQGREEPTGQAKLTPAFDLPCKYVIHTVGPIVQGRLRDTHRAQLAACYRACLEAADSVGTDSIAFCCISTGVFGFPQKAAAEVAVRTVKEYKNETGSAIKVIFNVFKDEDLAIYRELLGQYQ